SREPHSPRSCASVTTCSPIFCRTLRPPWLHPGRARRGARGARVRRSSVATSVVPADVQSNHLLPVRPVVGPPVPDPQCVPDAFAPQDARHLDRKSTRLNSSHVSISYAVFCLKKKKYKKKTTQL